MKNAVQDFKEFVLKGDVVSLAVAVVIATAFGTVIAAFVAIVLGIIALWVRYETLFPKEKLFGG